jgi:hypothetical protein
MTHTTDLDQWRTLSPKDFTAKLLSLAEENSDILPEKAYIGLMNASKVIHERTCHDEPSRADNDIDRLAHVILKLKEQRKEADELYKKYNGFKEVKNITKKIKEEAICSYAFNRCGVTLPVGTFKALACHCGIHIEPALHESFFRDYIEHRNVVVGFFREEYFVVCAYTDSRLKMFIDFYDEIV